SDDYSRYSTRPVSHEDWNPATKSIARKIAAEFNHNLDGWDVEVVHMGSTALEIAGKNEIELYVYPAANAWDAVFRVLTRSYGEPGRKEPDFIRFNAMREGFEAE